jgi:hypothetical protein
MTQNEAPPSNRETLALIGRWWDELERTLDGWSDAQMTERHDPAGWNVKDHLSHLMVWEQGVVALLQRQPRFEAMGFDMQTARELSEDELNARIQQRYAGASLRTVRDELRRTHAGLVAAIEALDDGDLAKPTASFVPNAPADNSGRPVHGLILGNSSAHFEEHLPWMRAIAERD